MVGVSALNLSRMEILDSTNLSKEELDPVHEIRIRRLTDDGHSSLRAYIVDDYPLSSEMFGEASLASPLITPPYPSTMAEKEISFRVPRKHSLDFPAEP
jgi:hypothetical protein